MVAPDVLISSRNRLAKLSNLHRRFLDAPPGDVQLLGKLSLICESCPYIYARDARVGRTLLSAPFCARMATLRRRPPHSPRSTHHASRYFSNFDRFLRLAVSSFNDLSLRTTLTGSTYQAFSGATYATNASTSFTLYGLCA